MHRELRLLRVASIVIGALMVPSVASAHLGLRRSVPDSNARLDRAPPAITLWFTQRPQLGFSRITLTGPAGPVALAPLVADTGNVIRAALPALGAGTYTVRWQTASADGHPIRGEFRFIVAGADTTAATTGPPAAVAAPAHVHEPSNETHATHEGYRSVRWIEFAALIAILGVIGFHHLVLPALAPRGVSTTEAFDRARRVGQMALGPYLVAAVVRLYAEWDAMRDMSGAADPAQLRYIVFDTVWGAGWLSGVVGALLVLAGWRLARSKRIGSTTLAALGGLAMAVSPALSGHAAAASPMLLNVTLDASHVLTAGFWVGGLFILVVAGLPAMLKGTNGRGDAGVAALVNSFHPVALVCAPFVLLSGAGSAWLRLGDPENILGSRYGQVLLVKVLMVLCVAALGFHNSARARRRLGTADATRVFRVTGWAEIAVAALVLAVTTVLIVTPLPAQPLFP